MECSFRRKSWMGEGRIRRGMNWMGRVASYLSDYNNNIWRSNKSFWAGISGKTNDRPTQRTYEDPQGSQRNYRIHIKVNTLSLHTATSIVIHTQTHSGGYEEPRLSLSNGVRATSGMRGTRPRNNTTSPPLIPHLLHRAILPSSLTHPKPPRYAALVSFPPPSAIHR